MPDPGEPPAHPHPPWCADCTGTLHRSRALSTGGVTLRVITAGDAVAVLVDDSAGRRVLSTSDAADEFGEAVRVLLAETLRGAT